MVECTVKSDHVSVIAVDQHACSAAITGCDLSTGEAQTWRLLNPLIDDFEAWLRENASRLLPKSKLDKAFKNAIKHWSHVKKRLERRAVPHREQSIRPFCVGRRAWLFSDTQAGAAASTGIYSIITTARANGLTPNRYIEWLLTEMPNAEGLDDPGVLDSFIPWAPNLPEDLRASPKAPRVAADDPIVDVDPHLLDEPPEGF